MDSNSVNQNKAAYYEQLQIAKSYSAFNNQNNLKSMNSSVPPLIKPMNQNNLHLQPQMPTLSHPSSLPVGLSSKSVSKPFSVQTQPPLSSSSLPQIAGNNREMSPSANSSIQINDKESQSNNLQRHQLLNENVHESSVVWTETLTKQVTNAINIGPSNSVNTSISNTTVIDDDKECSSPDCLKINDETDETSTISKAAIQQQNVEYERQMSQDSVNYNDSNLMVDEGDDEEKQLESVYHVESVTEQKNDKEQTDNDEQDNNCFILKENNPHAVAINQERPVGALNSEKISQEPPLTPSPPAHSQTEIVREHEEEANQNDSRLNVVVEESQHDLPSNQTINNDNDYLIPDDSVSPSASLTPSVSSTLVQHKLSINSNETLLDKNDENSNASNSKNDGKMETKEKIEEIKQPIKLTICKKEASIYAEIKTEAVDHSDFPLLVDTLNEDYSNDFCVICRNGGDLLICDYCPRVYHLQCHVPSIHVKPE